MYKIALAILFFIAAPAWAVGTVLSGTFYGFEPAMKPQLASECADTPLGYVQSAFKVSESGTYYFNDAFGEWQSLAGVGLDVTALVYEKSFDASAPGQNLIAKADLSFPAREVALSAGSSYILVVQLSCAPSKGAWAVMFVGPGTVGSVDAVALPSFSSGSWSKNGPTKNTTCSDDWGPYTVRYQQSGPFEVAHDGAYYFSTAGIYGLCLSIYSAPFDPLKPWVNKVGGSYPFERGAYPPESGIELKTGQNYYILVESGGSPYYGLYPGGLNQSEEYFFVLAPPAPFRVNHGLADSWYNPETPGQGFFLDVFEQLNQVFLGWFTFSSELPVAGDAGHRWMTALGPYAGPSAELAIEWTTGGEFDAAVPVPKQSVNGTIQLDFTDCTSGQITYAWGGDGAVWPNVSEVIPIQRLANDSVALCESLYAGPGMPGPL